MEEEEVMRIRFREATPLDKEGILKIASRTWEGWDYVPLIIDDWLREGGLFLAEKEGKIVGLTKTTLLSPGELWLEGLRVREDLRGQGIGQRLAKFQLDEALSRKPSSLRLSTAEVNQTSMRIIERLGFHHLCTFTYLEAKVREPRMASLLRPLRSAEEGWRTVEGSEFLRFSQGLLPAGWIFYEATRDLVANLVRAGMMFRSQNGVAILQPYRYDPQKAAEITFFSTSREDISELLNELNSLAFDIGYKEFSCFLPQDYGVEGFTKWGFQQKLKFRYVFVYQYPLNFRGQP